MASLPVCWIISCRCADTTPKESTIATSTKTPKTAAKAVKTAPKAVKTSPKTTPAKSDILSQLLEAGAHFGHRTHRWNPKTKPFIFATKNSVHIIDLIQTEQRLKAAQVFVRGLAAEGCTILYVGTKRQAQAIIAEQATSAGMPFVTHRWLGGMLTNFSTIMAQLKTLKHLEQQKADGELDRLTKKENLLIDDKIISLNKVFSGIREMAKQPDALFVVDVPREMTAVAEARKLGIPIVAIVDTNADPDLIDFPIPANDDAIKSIGLITREITSAIAEGRAEYDSKVAKAAESKPTEPKLETNTDETKPTERPIISG